MTLFSRIRRQQIPLRLNTSLQLTFVALVLIPTVVLTVLAVVRDINRQNQMVINQLGTVAEIERQAIRADISIAEDMLVSTLEDARTQPVMAALLAAPDDNSRVEFELAALRLAGETRSKFNRILLVGPDGIVVGASDSALIGQSVIGEEWFRAATIHGAAAPVLSDLALDPFDQESSYYLSLSVLSGPGGLPVGLLVGQIHQSDLVSIQLSPPGLGNTGEMLLIGQDGRYLITPRMASQEIEPAEPMIEAALRGSEGAATWRDYRGKMVVGVYRPLEELGIVVVVKQDLSEAIGPRQLTTILLYALIGLAIALVALAAGVVISQDISRPLRTLVETTAHITQGEYETRAPASDIIEINTLAGSFNHMAERLQQTIYNQEQAIRERTRQLEITARMGRVIAAETNLENLMRIAVEMLRDRLGYYHAQVFLIDDLRQYAVLRSSTGSVGRQLLERGHKLAVGSQSVIGQVTERGEPVLARDTDTSVVHRRNELLPDTRAELAIPLRIGDQIIGALDIQSITPDAFDEATISVLQTVADQLAVAIRNAQLFQEKEGLLSASVQLTQMLTRDSWDAYQRKAIEGAAFQYDLSDVRRVEGGEGANGHDLTTMPISLRGEVIGKLELATPEGREFSEEEKGLVDEVLGRVALALDNARLFEQTQQSLTETNRLYAASQRIAEASSPDDLAQRLMELCQVSAVDQALITIVEGRHGRLTSQPLLVLRHWSRPEGGKRLELSPSPRIGDFPFVGLEDASTNSVVINDLASSRLSDFGKTALQVCGVTALAHFPLVSSRRTLGWISLFSTRPRDAFSEEDSRFFDTVADQAATALESLLLIDETQQRARRLQATNEVTRAATSILNMDILLPLIVEQISQAFNYYHAQIFLVDDLGEWA
ncbi:MAG: GAF domain-containing protein, partial [Anaerolineae bacterium]|nr:GAF domain-containing protein [Anaerolineae bacterium]